MDKNLHDDSLEQFFKNHLEKFDGEPPTEMWNRIEEVIPSNPTPWWVANAGWISGTVGMVAIVATLGWFAVNQQSQNVTLSQELNKVQEQIELLEEEVSNLEENNESNQSKARNSIENPTISPLPSSVFEEDTKRNLEASEPANQKNGLLPKVIDVKKEEFDKPILNNNKTTTIPLQVDKDEFLNIKDNSKSEATTPIAKNKETAPTATIAEIEFIKSSMTDEIAANYENMPILPTIDPIGLPREPKGLIVEGFVSVLRADSDFGRRGSMVSPMLDQHAEKSLLGMGFGGQVGYSINRKWSIHTGLGYEQANIQHNLRKKLIYNKDGEVVRPGGKVENRVAGMFRTGAGDMSMGMVVHANQPIADGEKMDFTATLESHVATFNIPFYLKYKLINGHKLGIALKGGGQFEGIINKDFDILNYTINRGDVAIVKPPRIENLPSYQKSQTVAVLTGVEVAYKIDDQLSFKISPTVATNFSKNPPHTHLGFFKNRNFSIQGGVSYEF